MRCSVNLLTRTFWSHVKPPSSSGPVISIPSEHRFRLPPILFSVHRVDSPTCHRMSSGLPILALSPFGPIKKWQDAMTPVLPLRTFKSHLKFWDAVWCRMMYLQALVPLVFFFGLIATLCVNSNMGMIAKSKNLFYSKKAFFLERHFFFYWYCRCWVFRFLYFEPCNDSVFLVHK